MFFDLFYNDHYRPYWAAPVGGYGSSLMGAIGLSLATDKSVYKVGESPIYRITGAIPGSVIAWSSTKNGQQTGEYQASYGDVVDANGTAEITGGAWVEDNIGQWRKVAMILKDDGSFDLSNEIGFSVVAAGTSGGQSQPQQVASGGIGDWLSAEDFISGVPNGLIAAGAIIGGWALFGKRGR